MNCPIAIFAYRRLNHLRHVIDSLMANREAPETDLFIYSDGAKLSSEQSKLDQVRAYLRTVSGFKSTTIIERKTNYGISKSIIDGVTTLCNEYGRVGVLEDDVIVSPHFLSWINSALNKYSENEKVISVGCYVFPNDCRLPETYFLNIPDCWGWAVWKRSWGLFETDGEKLLREILRHRLGFKLDLEGTYPYTDMLRKQISGDNDSWAVRWYATAVLKGGLTIYPSLSMSANIGFDGSGTHCKIDPAYKVELAKRQIQIQDIPVEESVEARKAWKDFLKALSKSKQRNFFLSRIIRFYKNYVK